MTFEKFIAELQHNGIDIKEMDDGSEKWHFQDLIVGLLSGEDEIYIDSGHMSFVAELESVKVGNPFGKIVAIYTGSSRILIDPENPWND